MILDHEGQRAALLQCITMSAMSLRFDASDEMLKACTGLTGLRQAVEAATIAEAPRIDPSLEAFHDRLGGGEIVNVPLTAADLEAIGVELTAETNGASAATV